MVLGVALTSSSSGREGRLDMQTLRPHLAFPSWKLHGWVQKALLQPTRADVREAPGWSPHSVLEAWSRPQQWNPGWTGQRGHLDSVTNT